MQRLNYTLALKGLCLTAGVILGLTLLPSNALAQTTITEWNFNSTSPDNSTATGTTAPNINITGNGTAFTVGGTNPSFAAGGIGSTSPSNSSDPATTDDSGWNTNMYPAQGTNNKTAGVRFNVSTVGYQNIIVEWDQRFSNTASRNAQFQYSTDGTTFTDFGSLLTANTGDAWFNNNSRDLSSISGVNDNANFAFRIVSALSAANVYEAANTDPGAGSTTYATTGTWRFDMVQVNATPVPEPITILGSLTAIGIGTVIKRKHTSAGQIK